MTFFLNMPSLNKKKIQLLNFTVKRHLRNLGMKNVFAETSVTRSNRLQFVNGLNTGVTVVCRA